MSLIPEVVLHSNCLNHLEDSTSRTYYIGNKDKELCRECAKKIVTLMNKRTLRNPYDIRFKVHNRREEGEEGKDNEITGKIFAECPLTQERLLTALVQTELFVNK